MRWLHDQGRAEYVSASDQEALDGCLTLARTEGIIPALESAHAVAEVMKRAPQMPKSDIVIVNISGRGDKDIGILRENLRLRRFSHEEYGIHSTYFPFSDDPAYPSWPEQLSTVRKPAKRIDWQSSSRNVLVWWPISPAAIPTLTPLARLRWRPFSRR